MRCHRILTPLALATAMVLAGCATPISGVPSGDSTVSTAPSSYDGPATSEPSPTEGEDVTATGESSAAPTTDGSSDGLSSSSTDAQVAIGSVPVNADDFAWADGTWAFASPDGLWECQILPERTDGEQQPAAVRCESTSLHGAPDAAFPELDAADTAYLNCQNGAKAVAGVITSEWGTYRPPYGVCSDSFTPAFANADPAPRGLAPGELLTAGSQSCWLGLDQIALDALAQLRRGPGADIAGDVVTCVDAETNDGFSVWRDGYAAYPTQSWPPQIPGAAPADPSREMLGHDSYEGMKLGMSPEEVQAVFPSVVVQGNDGECLFASTPDADIVFNPDRTLSYIGPHGPVVTPEGLAVGVSTIADALALYTSTWETDGSVYRDGPTASVLVEPGSEVAYSLTGNFEAPTATANSEYGYDPATIPVAGIWLDGGQMCFG